MSSVELDPDRLLPADPGTRAIARRIFDEIEHLPIISPHGHVPARTLRENASLGDPAAFLITPDHYVTRLIHSAGVGLDALGLPATASPVVPPREVWRRFCEQWQNFDGTATGNWIGSALHGLLGLRVPLSPATADASFDFLQQRLDQPEFRPRALLERFDVEILATTDDPLDELDDHAALNADPTFGTRIVPTFRPDAYLDSTDPHWVANVDRLGTATGQDVSQLGGLLDGLAERRRHFIARGATATDHGVLSADLTRLPDDEARSLYTACRDGVADRAAQHALNAHLLFEMARMSTEDGLAMALHAGVLRNHHRPSFERFGRDTGHDLPTPTSFVEGLRDVLSAFGTHEDFSLILFTVDETAWSREIAPLAGFYPSVYVGAPWWFLDAPDAMRRFREATTESAGFRRYSGFVDDTRALYSISVRHDTARRVDSGFLARYVSEARLTEDRAVQIARETVTTLPRKAFKL